MISPTALSLLPRATLKKASNPTTDEYTALIKMIEGQPTFRVVEKTIKNSGNKKTYKGLTLKMMMDYISDQKNSEELMAEFNEAQGDAKNQVSFGQAVVPE